MQEKYKKYLRGILTLYNPERYSQLIDKRTEQSISFTNLQSTKMKEVNKLNEN